MQLLREVASFSPAIEDLKTIYFLFVRSLLEQSATVWHSGLTEENRNDLERIQKSAVRIILGDAYIGYKKSLVKLEMETLEDRRKQLCLNFALKCKKNPKTSNMFPENMKVHKMITRYEEKYQVEYANTERLRNSPIVYMQNLLNENELRKKK